MKLLLIGLGNIGTEYLYTRHNIGFLVVDYLASHQKATFHIDQLASIASFSLYQHQIYVIKPTTYMNNSGRSCKYWMDRLRIPIERTLTIVDDIGLPFGAMRLRPKGSDAGHNGLKSIAHALTSDCYPRLRVGIGNDFSKGKLHHFVLNNFNPEELDKMNDYLDKAREILVTWCHRGILYAMNQFN